MTAYPRTATYIPILAGVLFLGACERVSATSAVIDAPKPPADKTPTQELSLSDVDAKPRLAITLEARVDGEKFGLTNIKAVAASGSGELFVLDAMDARVLVFSPDGTMLRKFGGKGGGPGELDPPARQMVVARDTVYITDNRGLNRFHADGSFIAVHRSISRWKRPAAGSYDVFLVQCGRRIPGW